MTEVDTAAVPGFAGALRSAVQASGLGLERIQHRLAERGVGVSVATLSYWQSGARRPGRKGSREVVAELEDVLQVVPGSLCALIRPSLPRRRASGVLEDVPALPGHFLERDPRGRISELVDLRRERLLSRISQHDVVTVGRDRRVETIRIRCVLRADTGSPDGIGLVHFFEDPQAACPQIDIRAGGEIRAQHREPSQRISAIDVAFGHRLERGETVLLDYEVTAAGAGPRDRSYDCCWIRPIREYVLQVCFDPTDRPAWCERYSRCRDGGPDRRNRLDVDEHGHVHTLELNSAPGTIGLAWDWPPYTA